MSKKGCEDYYLYLSFGRMLEITVRFCSMKDNFKAD